MRFLLDQDVYATTARFLEQLGHDVVPAAREGLSRASDEELLRIAQEQERILVTRDRDFGALVFVQLLGAGVLYLRVLPSTQNAVHGELGRVLAVYSEKELSTTKLYDRTKITLGSGGFAHSVQQQTIRLSATLHRPPQCYEPMVAGTSWSRR